MAKSMTDTDDTGWIVRETDGDRERRYESRSDAENAASEAESLGMDVEVVAPNGNPPAPDTEDVEPDVVEHAEAFETPELPERSISEDPLDFLPSYMIDEVQGTPTLNKRGLSVLAFHYGIEVSGREIIASPHETEWESAIVETTVCDEDGRAFIGTGTAHVDRGDDREVLLELAETRSYKRAVSFATGTGIVSYQEMVSEVE